MFEIDLNFTIEIMWGWVLSTTFFIAASFIVFGAFKKFLDRNL